MAKPFFITTAIDYTNGAPHIGHAYEKILADVLARYHRLKGEPVFFLTGVDQHGQKVQQSAEKAGIEPQQYVDGITGKFTALWEKLDVRYDAWAATTDPLHQECVRANLQKLWDDQDPATGQSRWIYKKTQRGFYSVRQEQFLTDKERGPDGEFGPEWQPVEEREEENFYFRLMQDPATGLPGFDPKQWLLDFIAQRSADGNPFVLPDFRVAELSNAVAKLEGDLCISRPASRLKWGIPFPETFGAGFVTYVWFDALVNYISFVPGHDPHYGQRTSASGEKAPGTLSSAGSHSSELSPRDAGSELPGRVGILPAGEGVPPEPTPRPAPVASAPEPGAAPGAPGRMPGAAGRMPTLPGSADRQFADFWPPLHVLGKDILIPAHGVYWPIMLKALGFTDAEMPTLLVHGWWNISGTKMSKSLGNVIDPATLADTYGPEALRYYLMSDIATGKDADFDEARLIIRYNSDLANSLGNLLNRTLSMAAKYRGGVVQKAVNPIIHNPSHPTTSFDVHVELFVRLYRISLEMPAYREEVIPGIPTEEDPFFVNSALADALAVATQGNVLVESQAPWKLAKEEQKGSDEARVQLDAVLYHLAESLRIIAILISPVLPRAAEGIFDQLRWKMDDAGKEGRFLLADAGWGGLPDGHTLGSPVPLFPRIEPPTAV